MFDLYRPDLLKFNESGFCRFPLASILAGNLIND